MQLHAYGALAPVYAPVTLFVLFSSAEQILLSDLTHLVIDEADTLFDHSFVDATTSIIRHVNVRLAPSLPASSFVLSLSLDRNDPSQIYTGTL